jgi:MFS family permease
LNASLPAAQRVEPPEERDSSGRRVYRVGTLAYTVSGLATLFFWLLLGDFAFSMRERSAQPVVQLAMKYYEASATYMSIVLAVIPPAIGMTLGPIISYRSDRYRSRWGRRIPFLLWTTPLTFGSMLGLAYCPQLGEQTHQLFGDRSPGLNACVLAYFALFYTLFEFACIASLVLFGALVNDVVPRSMIGRFYGLFRAVSLGAGILFNAWLLGWSETHFSTVFVGISLLFGIGFTLMCFAVREGDYPPPPAVEASGGRASFFAAVGTFFRECFTLRYYQIVFTAMLLASLVFMPFNTFSLPYAKTLNVSTDRYGDLIAMSFMVSFVLAYPLGWLVDRFHPLRVGITTMAIYAVATTYGMLAVRDEATFAIALVAHTVLSGAYFTATAGLGAFLFPKSRFAQFASAASMASSAGSILVGLMIGPLLDFTGKAYWLTFAAGLVLCLASLATLVLTYRLFLRHGGPRGYVAPEIQPAATRDASLA